MEQMIVVLCWVYKQVLLLYPPSFRTRFGDEMVEVYVQRLAEGGGRTPLYLGLLLLRELRDLPPSLLQAYRDASMQECVPMSEPTYKRISWQSALLVLLPGIFALSYELGLWQLLANELVLPRRDYHFVLLVFCILLCLVGFVQQGRFAVWSFPALGIVLTSLAFNAAASLFLILLWGAIIGVMIAGWRGHALPWGGWQRWLLALLILNTVLAGFYVDADSLPPTPYEQAVQIVAYPLMLLAIFHVPPAIVGYLLARQRGVLAGLVMLGATFVVWDGIGDPAYALGMFTDNVTLVRVVALHPHFFFLILAPFFVLRARSNWMRVLGFLMPLTLAFCSADAIRSVIRPDATFGGYLIRSTVWISIPLGLALLLYLDSPDHRVRQRFAALLNR